MLKRLTDSARMVSGFSLHTRKRRDIEALTLRMGPFRNVLRPRFPEIVPGVMYAKAEAGSNAWLCPGCRWCGPGRRGRPGWAGPYRVPSTLPYPGASEPV